MNNSNTVKNKITRTKFANFLGSMAGLFGLIIIFSILSLSLIHIFLDAMNCGKRTGPDPDCVDF